MFIVLAGATGNLGSRIGKALVARGANVTALVRRGTTAEKVRSVEEFGATVALVDTSDRADVAKACKGAGCMVSAVQGLRDVVVDAQAVLLQAAVDAGVPRFIPSDYSTDFRRLPAGENRNFDLRRDFHEKLDAANVASTAIFNGSFADILTYNTPLFDAKKKSIGYWGDPDWQIDFTTMDNTAAFTATAAIDPTTPLALHIASFQVSPRQLAAFANDDLKTPFELVHLGSLDDLRAFNHRERAAHPEGERELYPAWQQSQYMQSMLSAHHESLDNARYPDVTWTTLQNVLKDAVAHQ